MVREIEGRTGVEFWRLVLYGLLGGYLVRCIFARGWF